MAETGRTSAYTIPRKTKGRRRWEEVRAAFPLKYGWWWKKTFYWPTARLYWRCRCRVRIGVLGAGAGAGAGSMMPKLGRGKYVSLKRRGPMLDLVVEQSFYHGERGDVIRLIPYQPNHGLMVEMWRDGRMLWRSHCGYDEFRKMGFGEADG